MNNRGSALVVGILALTLLFGMALVVSNLSVVNERDVRDRTELDKALYLAETGINASIHELVGMVDQRQDGLGTVSGAAAGGTYQVAATPRGDGSYDLYSQGFYQGQTYGVEVTVVPTLNGIFASAAVEISGVIDERIDLKERFNSRWVRINGGNRAAISVEDPEAYQELIDDVDRLISRKRLDPAVFSGVPTVKVTLQNDTAIELPFQQTDTPSIDSGLLDLFRVDLLSNVMSDLIPAAELTIDTKKTYKATSHVWGTESDPTIVVIRDDLVLDKDSSVTGNGTLVVLGKLTVKNSSSLNWTGDVIVMGDPNKTDNAKLTADGGTIDVNGNVILIEDDKGKKAILTTKHDELDHRSQVTINGTLLALNAASGKEAEVKTEKGGLVVNGLLVLTGQKNEIDNKDKKSNFVVNGSVQVGMLDGPSKKSRFKLNLKGPTYLTYDDKLILKALRGLAHLPAKFDLWNQDELISYAQLAWRPRHPVN